MAAMHNRRRSSRTAAGQGGIALVLVLWVVSLLAVISSAVAALQRTDSALTHHLVAGREGRALAEAGAYFVILRVFESGAENWPQDGSLREWSFSGRGVRVGVRDESGRIDLNAAPPKLLEGLVGGAVRDPVARQRLVDAVLDWRDRDDDPRPMGAEDDAYRAAGLPYGAKDGRIDQVTELRQVLGMTEDVYRALEPALTVHSGRDRINAAAAPLEVVAALPGMTPARARLFVRTREQHRAEGLPPPTPEGVEPGVLTDERGPVYRVRAEVDLEGGTVTGVEAVVRIAGGQAGGYQVLAWRNYRRSGKAQFDSGA